MSIADKIRGKKKKKSIEGDMVIDNPDIKVAAVSHKGKPFVIGIGTTEEREVEGEAAVNLPTGGKGKYQTKKGLKWQILYDPKVLPDMKLLENVKNVAASSIALASGSSAALDRTMTAFKQIPSETLGSWIPDSEIKRGHQRKQLSAKDHLRTLVKLGLLEAKELKVNGRKIITYKLVREKRKSLA